jgi:hypothetical protein
VVVSFGAYEYERLKQLKKHRGLTWRRLFFESEQKVREDTTD